MGSSFFIVQTPEPSPSSRFRLTIDGKECHPRQVLQRLGSQDARQVTVAAGRRGFRLPSLKRVLALFSCSAANVGHANLIPVLGRLLGPLI